MADSKEGRCAVCAPEAIGCLSEAREAVRLLSKIVQRATIEPTRAGQFIVSFALDIELHDRLCVWGSAGEDIEDDTPLEESDVEACI